MEQAEHREKAARFAAAITARAALAAVPPHRADVVVVAWWVTTNWTSFDRPRFHRRLPFTSTLWPAARRTSISPAPLRRCTTAPAGRSVDHWNARSSDPAREQAVDSERQRRRKWQACSFTKVPPGSTRNTPVSRESYGAKALVYARSGTDQLPAPQLDVAVHRLEADLRPAGAADVRPEMLRVQPTAQRHLEVRVQRPFTVSSSTSAPESPPELHRHVAVHRLNFIRPSGSSAPSRARIPPFTFDAFTRPPRASRLPLRR